MSKITNSYEFKAKSGGKPKQIVLLLHGLGADGRDLLGLAPEFTEELPDAVFVSPDAPFPCDMAPMGYQWFTLQDWAFDSMLRGIKSAAPILEAFMDEQLKKYDLPASKMALVGFSQGTMMSLYVGPRYKEQIAGILGYSGALVEEWDGGSKPVHKVPVHLIHGEMDTVVPIAAYHMAREILKQKGFTVTGHTTSRLMHGIDGDGVESGREFLKAVLVEGQKS
ncbi:MAG: phospholipase [Alphaproteobacteria bacterium]|nr:phospholipase [Alphaproteobacteria bacterium]